MKFSIDDPVITQYAVGELDDQELAQDIEIQLQDDAELQAFVQEMQALAGQLEEEFSKEPDIEWNEEEQKQLLDEPKKPAAILRFPYIFSSAIAACLVMAFLLNVTHTDLSEPETDLTVYDSRQKSEISKSEPEEAKALYQTLPKVELDADLVIADKPQALPIEKPKGKFHQTKAVDVAPSSPAFENNSLVQENPFLPPADQGLDRSDAISIKKKPELARNLAKEGSTSSKPANVPSPTGLDIGASSTVAHESRQEFRGDRIHGKKAMPATSAAPAPRRRAIAAKKQGYYTGSYADSFAEPSQSIMGFVPQGRVMMEIPEPFNREAYDNINDNVFKDPRQDPLSTFSVDVDTASYSNLRRMLKNGMFPPAGAVRIEEMINYFPYRLDGPAKGAEDPFRIHTEVAGSPWSEKNILLKVAIKGYDVPEENRPDANLVFLLDVSGSMNQANKLPLLKKSLELLVSRLGEKDRVAIVVYAGASGLALPSTTANNKQTITHALNQLHAGGSTNGGAGIELAYKTAQEHFIKGGNNRVILCTDGDFNVGTSDRSSLLKMIKDKAKSGVFLSILGFGSGNFQDATMEELSNSGNGNYAYIDELKEARKVLVEQAGGTLLTIAKDVKIQIEFNPQYVSAYRLIGYANRVMAAEDFNNDKKDAGEIGAGHSVTALYEIVPAGEENSVTKVDPLKYQTSKIIGGNRIAIPELCTVKFRYKKPDGDVSKLIEHVVTSEGKAYKDATEHLRFASAVAGFGMLLRDSEHKGDLNYEKVIKMIEASKGYDEGGYRSELRELVEEAARLSKNK